MNLTTNDDTRAMPVVEEHRHRSSADSQARPMIMRRVHASGYRMLRWSLAVVFIWFGGLKLSGRSPVTMLLEATVPGIGSSLMVNMLGVIELALGIGLLITRLSRFVALLAAAHLTGTLLTFVMAPELMMRDGNPLVLTTEGEFVLKNLVLISGALILAATSPQRSNRGVADDT